MNQLQGQMVGAKLRHARESMGVSLEEAARVTSIRVNYLLELENDHPEIFTSVAQARGFLRLYASFLNLPVSELIEQWETPLQPQESVTPEQTQVIVGEGERFTETVGGEKSAGDGEETPGEELQRSDVPTLEEKKKGILSKQITVFLEKAASLEIFNKLKKLKENVRLPEVRQKEKPPEISQPLESSEEIFKEIGETLHSRRLKMDLDLTDVEHFTNLKRMYLVALEDGRFNDLPSTVQGRGMLNNYAQFLAMEESAVMDRYAQALQLQRDERMPPVRRQTEPPVSVKVNLPEGLRRVLNPDLVVGGALILVLFGFILWGASQILGISGEEPTDAPSISEMLQVTPSISPSPDQTQLSEGSQPAEEETPVPGVAISQATPTPIATVNAAPLQLYIIANDRAYLRINVDGRQVFDGRVAPDNVYTYSGNNQITLLTGNAAALEVYFNQDYLGNLGDVGEVVDIRFSLSGLTTPTPRATLTPTANPRAMEEDGVMEEN